MLLKSAVKTNVWKSIRRNLISISVPLLVEYSSRHTCYCIQPDTSGKSHCEPKPWNKERNIFPIISFANNITIRCLPVLKKKSRKAITDLFLQFRETFRAERALYHGPEARGLHVRNDVFAENLFIASRVNTTYRLISAVLSVFLRIQSNLSNSLRKVSRSFN